MSWGSFAEFADMGGYALYVWGSYFMCAAALGWEALALTQRRRRAVEELRAAAELQWEERALTRREGGA